MITQRRVRQALAVARLEMRRAFFSKRALWVYLLALFPVVLFLGHGLEVKARRDFYERRGAIPAALIDSVRENETDEAVRARLGRPVSDTRWRRRERGSGPVEFRYLQYYDGRRLARFTFKEGVLESRNVQPVVSIEEDRPVFAAVFQHYYLRLAVFFGCLGIFMNLFRGKMMDKTLHFWLLAPVRREVLLGGKFLAGLVASSVIFSTGALLAYAAMLWPQHPLEVEAFWRQSGAAHAMSYMAAAALACVGYGSVFLAAGLLVRNPIVPAGVLLLWEGANPFLPSLLQKISVLYYVQAFCPTPPPTPPDMPALLRLIFSPAAPPSKWLAVAGLLAVTGVVLWAAGRAVRRLQINYSTD